MQPPAPPGSRRRPLRYEGIDPGRSPGHEMFDHQLIKQQQIEIDHSGPQRSPRTRPSCCSNLLQLC